MKRLHTIRPSRGLIFANYRDEENAHTEITIEQAKADFIFRADKTIADFDPFRPAAGKERQWQRKT